MKTWIVALMLVAGSAMAQTQEGWHDRQGSPITDTPSQKSKKGFSGLLIITPDKDWAEKWNTPVENTPHFSAADQVRLGGELHMLIFLVNPKLDAQRKADVRCDIRVTRPNGSLSADEENLVCFQGAMPGNLRHIHLSAPVIKFIAEEGDPPGVWTMNVTLRDTNRRVTLMLEESFTLLE